MIAILLAAVAQAAGATPAPLGPIGRQALPARGCAAYLWSAVDRQLVAMAVAEPATVRLSIGGKTADFARVGEQGAGAMGFAGTTLYRAGDVAATVEMTIAQQGLDRGAYVPNGSITVERSGQDALVVPVAGMIGCRS